MDWMGAHRIIRRKMPRAFDGKVSEERQFGKLGFALVLLVLTLSVILVFVEASDGLGWITLLVGLAVVVLVARGLPAIAKPLLIGFGLRMCLALLHYYVVALPDSQADALRFEMIGWEWSQHGLAWLFHNVSTGSYLYSWFIALLYSVLGRSALMIQGINVLFGSLVIGNVFRTARFLWDEGTARKAAWFTAVFPTLALYSALTMREVAVVYPLSLGALSLVRWLREGGFRNLALAMLWFAISLAFHTGVAAAFVATGIIAVVGWIRAIRTGTVDKRVQYGVAIGGITIVVLAVILTGWGLGKFGSLNELSIAQIRNWQAYAARSRASYLEGLVPRSAFDLLWHIPLRLGAFLFTPFPWMVSEAKDLAGVADAFFYIALVWQIIKHMPDIKREWSRLGLLLLFGTLAIMFSMGTSNYGTAIRHRAKLVPLLIALGSYTGGYERKVS